MNLFFVGLAILLVGYLIYGKLVEKIFAPDDREVPATKMADGLDYMVLPNWKNKLIQLLNIAGIGPVIGVIAGVKFGDLVFIIIPVGCVLMGAVHDFASGMISMRTRGANLTELVRITAGKRVYYFFLAFVTLALLLVVAVFINIPAKLTAGFFPQSNVFYWAVGIIFLYYVLATLFPIDQIIGRFYPIFGLLLLLSTLILGGVLIYKGMTVPGFLSESAAFKAGMFKPEKMPIIPMLFVTIACGILSGFHATQSPIVARTISHEKQAKGVFFGMMILEGLIAMIWAAGALAIYNKMPELMSKAPTSALVQITKVFLNVDFASTLVIISVIILAVTSGDTAMRSLRLSIAEAVKLDQKPLRNRLLIIAPLVAVVTVLLIWSNKDEKSFGLLWNYFAWSNQVLAVFTFVMATVYLSALRKPTWITVLPGLFITFVVSLYILWISPEKGGPVGVGLSYFEAQIASGFFAVLIFAAALMRGAEIRGNNIWEINTEKKHE